jgi:hypothetical protein
VTPAPPAIPEDPSKISVQVLDRHTVAIGDGLRKIVLRDGNCDGRVDHVGFASQAGEQVYGGSIRRDASAQVLPGEWGEPHLRNLVYEGVAKANFVEVLDELKRDAGDGVLNAEALFERAVAILNNPASAGTGGRRSDIADVHADHTLVIDPKSTIAVDTEDAGGGLAFAENAKFSFDGSQYTITNIWNRTGGDGPMGVRLAQPGDGGESMATFEVADPDTLRHSGTGTLLGQAQGSVGKHVLNADGRLDFSWSRTPNSQ